MSLLTRRAGREFVLLVALVVGATLASCAHAQQTPPAPTNPELEKRVRELEEIVRQLLAEREQARAAQATFAPAPPTPASAQPQLQPAPTPGQLQDGGAGGAPAGQAAGGGDSEGRRILAGFDEKDGFFIRSSDKRFNLRLTGQIQADYRGFLDGLDTTDISSFLVRRARLGIEANMFEAYEFRLLPDFSNGQSATNPTASTRIQDAYINVHYWDCFQVEAGKFKQPFSYEQLIQDRFVPTMERSLIDQLVPARDEGVMVHGQRLFGDRLDYGIAVSNGETNGDFDTNKLKDLNGRVAVRPLNCEVFWPILRGLQVGISGGTGIEQEPVSPNQLRTPATVLWFQYNSTVQANGMRDRWSPEVAYFYGPFGFAAQYFREEQRLSPAASGTAGQIIVDVPYEGFYFLTTLLLTGEDRITYSRAIAPLRPFDPCHPFANPGAWELVARVSRLEVGEQVFTPIRTGRTTFVTLSDPTRYSSAANELTLGFNWYLNAWARVQFNWEHAWFHDPVRLGPGPDGLLKHQDTLLTRFQVIF